MGSARVLLLGVLGIAMVAGFLLLATRGDGPRKPPASEAPTAVEGTNPRLDLEVVASRLDEMIAAYGDENMAVAAIRPLVDRTLPTPVEERKQMLLDALGSERATVRWLGLLSAYHYGDADARMVKLLLVRTYDEDGRVSKEARAVLGNLSKVDQAGGALLERAYADAQPVVRAALLRALVRTRPRDLTLKSRVMVALKSDEVLLRRAATHCLSRLDFGSREGNAVHPHDDVIDPLRDALADEDSEVRFTAAMALSRFGPAAARTIPALVHALGDPDTGVSRWSETALSQMGPEVLPAVEAVLESADAERLSAAIWILRRQASEPESDRILRRGTEHGSALVRAWSLSGLVDLDAQDIDFAKDLGALLVDQAPAVVRVSLQALARIGRRAAPVREVVEGLVESEDREIRRWARAVLVGIGKPDKEDGDGGR